MAGSCLRQSHRHSPHSDRCQNLEVCCQGYVTYQSCRDCSVVDNVNPCSKPRQGLLISSLEFPIDNNSIQNTEDREPARMASSHVLTSGASPYTSGKLLGRSRCRNAPSKPESPRELFFPGVLAGRTHARDICALHIAEPMSLP